MENTIVRNILVDALVDKIVHDYNDVKKYYYRMLKESDVNDDSLMEEISIYTIVMNWVKDVLIDNNCKYFRIVHKEYDDNVAIYCIDLECLEILLNRKTNFVKDIINQIIVYEIFPITYAMTWLTSLSELNIGHELVSIMDRCVYQMEKEKEND